MLSIVEAYEASFAPGVVGASLVARELVDRIAAGALTAELAHAVEFARNAIRVADVKCRLAAERVRVLLDVDGAPEPSGFDAWQHRAREAVAARTTGAAARVAELGTIAGELYLATWSARTLVYLRTAEATNAQTTRQAEVIDRRVGELRGELAAVRARGELPAAVVDATARLAELVEQPRAAAAASTVEDYRAYFEWAMQIWKLAESIGAMLRTP